MLPTPFQAWLKQAGHGSVTDSRPVGGGCITDTSVISCSDGQQFFLKQYRGSAAAAMFAGEAAGLEAMRRANGPRIPAVYCRGDDFLCMEWLPPGRQQDDYWLDFGRQLAHMHQTQQEQFGFDLPTCCGSTVQDNSWNTDGCDFFATQRLLPLAQLNQDNGRLSKTQVSNIEELCSKLPYLIPEQPASLIHGDLWSGNAHTGTNGEPALIDPACAYGWREADLAMTAMFGSFPEEFYDGYLEVCPLPDEWQERFEIYNIYHYLNHLYLFGSSYLAPVLCTLRRYIG